MIAIHVHCELDDLGVESVDHLHHVEVVHLVIWVLSDVLRQLVNQSLYSSCSMDVK